MMELELLLNDIAEEEANAAHRESHIPFMDFSFFPVEVDASVLAEADQEFENFGNLVKQQVDFPESKTFDCIEKEFADIVQSDDFLTRHPSVNSEDSERDWSSSPSLEDESSSSNTDFSSDFPVVKEQNRFKPIHEEKWNLRFNEFLQFVRKTGHGAVPHNYPENQKLARWVKRQRRQYKLMNDKQPSTMTVDRAELLSTVGMIWDTHEVNWTEKIHALEQFFRQHGHTNVPTKFKENNLGIWVKCQRRQYKLYREGKTSAMTPERISQLEKFNFKWEVHGATPKSAAKKPTPKASQMTLIDQRIPLNCELKLISPTPTVA